MTVEVVADQSEGSLCPSKINKACEPTISQITNQA